MKIHWGIAFWGGLMFCAWNWSDRFPFRDEFTVYLGFCPKERVGGVCPVAEEAANPTTYKVLVDQQAVVYWVGDGAPSKLEHCAVRDSRNWSCQIGDGKEADIRRQLADGEYGEVVFNSTLARPPAIFYQVPKWKWWMLHVGMK